MHRAFFLLAAQLAACTGPTTDGDGNVDDSDSDVDGNVDDSDSDVDTEDTEMVAPLAVEVGTGSSAFESVDELDEVTLWYGDQGGYHMLGGFRVCGIGSLLRVNFKVIHEASGTSVAGDGGAGVDYNVVALTDPDPNCWQYYDLLGYMVNFEGLESGDLHDFLPGDVVEFQFDITDTDDVHAYGTQRVTVSCGPNDECNPANLDTDM